MQASRPVVHALVYFVAKVDGQRRSRVHGISSSAQYSIKGSRVEIGTGGYSCSHNSAEREKPHGREHRVLVQKQWGMQTASQPLQETANPSFLYLSKW